MLKLAQKTMFTLYNLIQPITTTLIQTLKIMITWSQYENNRY